MKLGDYSLPRAWLFITQGFVAYTKLRFNINFKKTWNLTVYLQTLKYWYYTKAWLS